VFPLPDGTAYLVSSSEQSLFLLSGDRAKRVENVQLSGLDATVYSLPNGAAYLSSSDGHRLLLYYLVGDKATLVEEGPIAEHALQRPARPSEAYLWTQIQAARVLQRRAKADEDPQDVSKDADDN
jgi:hypothetical protein